MESARGYQDWESQQEQDPMAYSTPIRVEDSSVSISVPPESIPQIRSNIPIDAALRSQKWFFPNASREVAEEILAKTGDIGSYVVRPSSDPNCFAISFMTEGRAIKHQLIYYINNGFTFKERPSGQDALYPSVQSLLNHCPTLVRLQRMANNGTSVGISEENWRLSAHSSPVRQSSLRMSQDEQIRLDEEIARRLANEESREMGLSSSPNRNAFPIRNQNASPGRSHLNAPNSFLNESGRGLYSERDVYSDVASPFSSPRDSPSGRRSLAQSLGSHEDEALETLLTYKSRSQLVHVEMKRSLDSLADSDSDGVEIIEEEDNTRLFAYK